MTIPAAAIASAGKAKHAYWLDVSEPWPDINYTDIRVRKLGPPATSDEFVRNAEYRGLPAARCGDRVKVGDNEGVIVGHNSSANFDVLFDGGEWNGLVLNCHPSTVEFRRDSDA